MSVQLKSEVMGMRKYDAMPSLAVFRGKRKAMFIVESEYSRTRLKRKTSDE